MFIGSYSSPSLVGPFLKKKNFEQRSLVAHNLLRISNSKVKRTKYCDMSANGGPSLDGR